MASQYCDVLPGQVCWRSFDPALYLIFGVSGVQICLTKNRTQRVIPMPSRLWILEKRSLRHRPGDRARPRAHSGAPRARYGKFHRPSAAFFSAHPARRGAVHPRAGAIPGTSRLPQTPSVAKVQKLIDFGILHDLEGQSNLSKIDSVLATILVEAKLWHSRYSKFSRASRTGLSCCEELKKSPYPSWKSLIRRAACLRYCERTEKSGYLFAQ